MVIDEVRTAEIKQVFEQVYAYKEQAKDINGSASDLMKVLALKLDLQDHKVVLKSLNKAYAEWKSNRDGEEDSLDYALTILSALEV